MKTGAELLTDWIDRQGLSDVFAAKKLGVSKSFLCRMQQGTRWPSLARSAKIERITGIPMSAWVSRKHGISKSSNNDGIKSSQYSQAGNSHA